MTLKIMSRVKKKKWFLVLPTSPSVLIEALFLHYYKQICVIVKNLIMETLQSTISLSERMLCKTVENI